jgi:cytochrome b pre-mRNA-processing protein 3
MLRFLFPGLTATPERGAALFDAVTSKSRERHWYVEGEVPDTLDGRFAMLATIAALSPSGLSARIVAAKQSRSPSPSGSSK